MPHSRIPPVSLLTSEQEQELNQFHTALLNGQLEQVRFYLKKGINTCIKDQQFSRTCVALALNNLECLQLLKQHMAAEDWQKQFLQPDMFGNLVLHLALAQPSPIFEYVHREGGYNFMEVSNDYLNIYHLVSCYTLVNFNYINQHLNSDQRHLLLSSASASLLTPIYNHIYTNNICGLQALLTLPEANVNQQFYEYRITPLFTAIEIGNHEAIIVLLRTGANLNHVDLRGFTPLILAIKSKNYPVARLLIKAGASINQVLDQGFTALHKFFKYNPLLQKDALQFILNNGGDESILKEDFYGYRPIEWLNHPVDEFVDSLGDIEQSLRLKLKKSFRNKARYIDARALQTAFSQQFPVIGERLKNGFCNGFSIVGAIDCVRNNFSLNTFYAHLERAIELGAKSSLSKEEHFYLWQLAENFFWMQIPHLYDAIFKKMELSGDVRYVDAFGQLNRKKALSYISEKPFYGPFAAISLFYRANYDGRNWQCELFLDAIERAFSQSQIVEVISEKHISAIVKRDGLYLLIEQNLQNKLTVPLESQTLLNLLFHYHYANDDSFNYQNDGIFPFSVRGWNLQESFQDEKNYRMLLKKEIAARSSFQDLTYLTTEQNNLVFFAIGNDDWQTLQVLLELYPHYDINTLKPKYQLTPLHFAVRFCAYECIKILLDHPQVGLYNKDYNGSQMINEIYENEPLHSLFIQKLQERRSRVEISKMKSQPRFFALKETAKPKMNLHENSLPFHA